MNNHRIRNIGLVLICLLVLVAEAFAITAVIRLDMLPGLYLGILIGFFGLLSIAVALLFFWEGRGEGKGRRIIGCVLALLIICGSVVLATVATDIMKTFLATNQELTQESTREIYVRSDDTAATVADTSGYTYGYVKDYDEVCTNQVLAQLLQQTQNSVNTAGFTNTFTMVNALLQGKIDAIILNGGLVSILEDTEEFALFSQQTRVLTQIKVTGGEAVADMLLPVPEAVPDATAAATEPEQTQPVTEPVDYTQLKPFAVYVSGSDSYDTEIVINSRSDVNILAVVNPLTKQILLVNTPRDYYVQNTAGNGKRDKLTHCGIYGIDCSMDTLSALYDVPIDYYVKINFTGFKKLIDAMGGITVYSDYAFVAITRTPIAKGENQLTGQQALDFARERVTLPDGDNERGRHQMQVITAVIEKATGGTTILSNYSGIMESVEGMFQMNVPMEMISAMLKMQLQDMASWNVVSYGVSGTNAMKECYSVKGMDLAVIEPSQSSVNKAIRLIEMVMTGEVLTEAVMSNI